MTQLTQNATHIKVISMKTMIKNNIKKISSACLMSTVMLAGCQATNGLLGASPANVQWVKQKPIPFEPATAATLPENTANLVFFREADDKNEQTAVNIGINDRYQASLRGGNYTAVPSCTGNTKISTLITGKKINDLEINPNAYNMVPGENYYFEVFVDEMGNSQATPVQPEDALKKLDGKMLQSHTISRVIQHNCAKPAPAPVVVEEKQPIKLSGIYFFDFDIPVMTASERDRANQLGNKILSTGYSNYEVVLSGHADPMGDQGYNQSLSNKRVNDVYNALTSVGVDPSRIRKAAYGETQPTKLTCMQIRERGNRNDCNVANRRVEAHVTLTP